MDLPSPIPDLREGSLQSSKVRWNNSQPVELEKQLNKVKSGLTVKINPRLETKHRQSLSEDRENKGYPVFKVGGSQLGALNRV